jgi:hypothetical protein
MVSNIFLKGILAITIGPIFWLFSKSSRQGAQTQLYCALEDFDKIEAGKYYCDCKVKKEKLPTTWEQDMQRFWHVTEELIKPFL